MPAPKSAASSDSKKPAKHRSGVRDRIPKKSFARKGSFCYNTRMKQNIKIALIVAGVIAVLFLARELFIKQFASFLAPSDLRSYTTSVIKNYNNPAIGISFDYPSDWRLDESGADPVTRGDIMRDGKIYTSFSTSLFPPERGQNSNTYIQILHGPLTDLSGASFDNLPIEEQAKKIDCPKENCKAAVNNNIVKYFKSIGCIDNKGCALGVDIPTGKYIVGIVLLADNLQEISKSEVVLDGIVKSMKLQ